MHDVFVASDLHGMYDLYRAILDYCAEQDPEFALIYLGDACDRGRDGYRMMKELLDNPQVIYLKGNHEDMFTRAARQIKEMLSFEGRTEDEIRTILNSCLTYDYKYCAIQDSLYNGGLITLMDWIKDGMPMEIVERIEQLPLTFSYEQYDFCHAAGVYKSFKIASDAEYENKPFDQFVYDTLLWNRSGYNYGWAPGRTVIFGHTPTPYLAEDLNIDLNDFEPLVFHGAFAPEDGTKIDIDTGAAISGYSSVLNVLTMKAQGFRDIDISSKNFPHRIEKIGIKHLEG